MESIYPQYYNLKKASFVLHEKKLLKNLNLIKTVKEKAGVQIILALKGFAMWKMFPTVYEYLDGATASSLNEARLIYEEMQTHAHSYLPVYLEQEFSELAAYSKHMVFNSLGQYLKYKDHSAIKRNNISCGLRVNPMFSRVQTELYNPTSPGSRLGIDPANLANGLPDGIEGLHFHALCESTSYDLEETLSHFEKHYGHILPHIKWVNMGGGHLMTRKGYDTDHLIKILSEFRQKYNLEIILEPGSAIAWETGDLVGDIIDVVDNHGIKTLMTNISFTAHMPDTLEMPYRPEIAGTTNEVTPFKYRIGGTSCLSGDYMEEYNFIAEPSIGDKLVFKDMIHYTIVKTTMFNGIDHPDICLLNSEGALIVLKTFNYNDYRDRMC